ncbi:2-C-methyl-D-erythritol 2,4-cyclodiphosphate synthase [bacterium]|nr:2-C-methyl-D-erythritol 2,4-cyclodiphosphate synthase [bacterium]
MELRVGIGYDAHRLAAGRRLVLGGVDIPHERGLLGHSDADVLAHAITDAILGARALGDIGHYFPPCDERWKDAASLDLLRRVLALPELAGWQVVNVDSVVVAERPRLSPHVAEMTRRLSAVLGCPAECVSIKATTNEGMGPEGQGEGITARAVVLLKKET